MRMMPVWIEQIVQDVRYTLRMIRRAPAFAAVVILTLAVAVGMNTAIFSVFNAVILRPLAYPHPGRLVWLSLVGADGEMVTGPEFADWRDTATSFDLMVAYGHADSTVVSTQGAAVVRAAQVTQDFWELSGAKPVAGRLPREDERGVVLLTHGFAQRWFAGDPEVIGRTITLAGHQVTIVGVLPQDLRFHFPGSRWPGFRARDVDLYQPMTVSSARTGMVQVLNVVGRLRPGTTRDAARAEIEVIRSRSAAAHPAPFDDQRTLRIVPLHDELVGGAGRALPVLLGAVAFVLLIACANAANLLLARASARQREIAVRMAVGAARGRLLRQLLVESVVLAGIGGAAGLLLANAAVAGLLRVAAQAIPRLAETTLDRWVLVAAVGISAGTALLSGLAPALALRKTNPHDALQNGVSTSPSAADGRLRRVLVAGEIALALVLLAAAGLLLKGFWRMNAATPGFEPQRVLTARLELSGPGYGEPRRQIAFVDELLARLRSERGVEAATISTHGYSLTAALMVEGEPVPTFEELARKTPITINSTSAALRQVMGLRIVRGRWFADNEAAAVLNESLARRDFPVRDPIGRRIKISDNGPLLTIVGIVADLKYSKLDAPPEPEVDSPVRARRRGAVRLQHSGAGETGPVRARASNPADGRGDRPDPGCGRRDDAGTAACRFGCAASLAPLPPRHVRGNRAIPRGSRGVQRHGVCGSLAGAGNRRANGSRRAAKRCRPHDRPSGHGRNSRGHRRWARRGAVANTPHGNPAVRSAADRPGDVCGRDRHPCRDRACRLLRARAQGSNGRPVNDVAL